MNFLLIPKKGKPRFHTGDPFSYIEKKGMLPVKDYFDFSLKFLYNKVDE